MIVIRALIAVVLVLNGMAMPPATAMHATAGTVSNAGHHMPDPPPDAAHDRHSTSMPGADCCEKMSCDCGCVGPQAAALPAAPPRIAWRTVLPGFTFAVKSIHSSPLSAPFRPPA